MFGLILYYTKYGQINPQSYLCLFHQELFIILYQSNTFVNDLPGKLIPENMRTDMCCVGYVLARFNYNHGELH